MNTVQEIEKAIKKFGPLESGGNWPDDLGSRIESGRLGLVHKRRGSRNDGSGQT
jgi:hypothetical protein